MQKHAGHRHRPFALEEKRRGHLRERLEHQHARHQRRAGKMPLKEVLVDRDVFMRDQPTPRLVLGDGIDEHRGMAIAKAVEECRHVERHGFGKNT